MSKITFRFLCLCVVVLLATVPAQAQIFFEDFQGGIPATFTLIDADGRTPASGVSYVTDAWVAQDANDGFGGPAGDTIAVSTSWYSPAGPADDWMITPAIALPTTPQVLRWEAKAQDGNFPDGYEVLVSTTGVTVADFTAAPIFSIASESATWTPHQVDLSAFADSTVYIAFRNNSNDQFLLLVDDIEVTTASAFHDVSVEEVDFMGGEYSRIPVSQLVNPFEFGAKIFNTGFDPVTQISVVVDVEDQAGNVVFTDSMGGPIDSLAVGDSLSFSAVGSFTPPATADIYVAQYTASIAEADQDSINDVFFDVVLVTDSVYARDANTVNGIVSLGSAAGSGTQKYGQNFAMPNGGTVTGMDAFLVNPTIGGVLTAELYTADAATGAPQNLISTSQPHTVVLADSFNFVNFQFSTQLSVPANTGIFVAITGTGPDDISVGAANDIFTPGTAFTFSDSISAGQWIANENFWVDNFSFIIRPALNFCLTLDGITGTTPDDGTGNGTAGVVVSGGQPPYTYNWSNGATTDTASFLAAGIYNVTVTDAQGCVINFDSVTVDTTIVGSIGDEFAGISLFEAFPNPSTGVFTVNVELAEIDDLKIEVLDLAGRTVFRDAANRVNTYHEQVNLNSYNSGVYILRLTTSQGATYRRLVTY